MRKLTLRQTQPGDNVDAWRGCWMEWDGKVINIGGRSPPPTWRGYSTEWRHPHPTLLPRPVWAGSFLPSKRLLWISGISVSSSITELGDSVSFSSGPSFPHHGNPLQLPFSLPTFHSALLSPSLVIDVLLTAFTLCSGIPLLFLTTSDNINIWTHCLWSVSDFAVDITMNSYVNKWFTIKAPWNIQVEQNREHGGTLRAFLGTNPGNVPGFLAKKLIKHIQFVI